MLGVAFWPFPISQAISLGQCSHLEGNVKVHDTQPGYVGREIYLKFQQLTTFGPKKSENTVEGKKSI